jgi:hypothetical protein
MLEAALASELRNLRAEHPSVALTRATFASVLHRLAENDRAEHEAKEALRAALIQPAGSRYRVKVERLIGKIR